MCRMVKVFFPSAAAGTRSTQDDHRADRHRASQHFATRMGFARHAIFGLTEALALFSVAEPFMAVALSL